MSAKLYFAENTIKIVFSAEHSFCASQIVNPLSRPLPKMALLQPRVPFWVFPCACWNPYFCSVLYGHQKRTIFPIQIVSTKMRVISFWTQRVFASFSKKCHLSTKPFSSQAPKNHYFSVLFYFPFPCFLSFSFAFSNIQKTKPKMHFFVRKPFFATPTTCQKRCSHPIHTTCDSKIAHRHSKMMEKQAKQILDRFWTQPWTDLWLKKGQKLDRFLTLQEKSRRRDPPRVSLHSMQPSCLLCKIPMQHTICVSKRTHRVFLESHKLAAELSEFSLPQQCS